MDALHGFRWGWRRSHWRCVHTGRPKCSSHVTQLICGDHLHVCRWDWRRSHWALCQLRPCICAYRSGNPCSSSTSWFLVDELRRLSNLFRSLLSSVHLEGCDTLLQTWINYRLLKGRVRDHVLRLLLVHNWLRQLRASHCMCWIRVSSPFAC